MSLRLSRRTGFAAAALSLFLVILSEGCSQQGEGERCVRSVAGDKDCDSGLVCTQFNVLLVGEDKVDRCCPPEGSPIHDSRCTRGIAIHTSGGSTGSGGSSAGGVSSGGLSSSEGGTTSSTAEGGATATESSGGSMSSAEGGSTDTATPSSGGAP